MLRSSLLQEEKPSFSSYGNRYFFRNMVFYRCLLINSGLPIPTTGFANSPLDTEDLIQMVGGAPLIVKLLEGTQGKGVVLAETKKAAESLINAFKSLRANILVQEFIKEADGKDIRCFVVNGKVVESIMRTAAPGEFRANIHLGGTAQKIKITPTERKIAILAAKTLNLKVAGVDIIRGKNSPLLLEVNSSPGLEGIEGVSNKDIAGLMIDAIEKDLKFLPQNRVGHVPDIHRYLPNFHIISELFKLNEGVKLSNSLAREISGMPTHDIQPWEVTPDDVAFMYTDKFWSQQENPFEDRMPSHQDILDDATEYTSLYKDKHAGYGMSYHHHNSFVKNILPALMRAKTLSSLSFAPPMYPLYEKFLLRGIRRLRKLDIIYQVEEPMMDIALRYMVENGQDFENTLEIYTHSDLNPDWEDKLNVKFV